VGWRLWGLDGKTKSIKRSHLTGVRTIQALRLDKYDLARLFLLAALDGRKILDDTKINHAHFGVSDPRRPWSFASYTCQLKQPMADPLFDKRPSSKALPKKSGACTQLTPARSFQPPSGRVVYGPFVRRSLWSYGTEMPRSVGVAGGPGGLSVLVPPFGMLMCTWSSQCSQSTVLEVPMSCAPSHVLFHCHSVSPLGA